VLRNSDASRGTVGSGFLQRSATPREVRWSTRQHTSSRLGRPVTSADGQQGPTESRFRRWTEWRVGHQHCLHNRLVCNMLHHSRRNTAGTNGRGATLGEVGMAVHIPTVAVPYQAPAGWGRSPPRPHPLERHRRSCGCGTTATRAATYVAPARAHGRGDSVHMHPDVDVHARYATDPGRSEVRI